jgi:hypothetical protein
LIWAVALQIRNVIRSAYCDNIRFDEFGDVYMRLGDVPLKGKSKNANKCDECAARL